MFRRLFAALWLLSLAGNANYAHAADGLAPPAVVEHFHAALLDNMKAGKQQSFEARRKHLEPVVKDTFDLVDMARLSTGGAWAKLSEDDKAKIIAAFADWTIANYAANFKEWDGEAFVTKDSTDDGKGNVVVNTRLTQKGDPPVVFAYRMRKVDDGWRIIDIYLDGAISQLAMHRGEFAAVLARGTVDDLVKHMHDLTAQAMKTGA